MSIPLDNLYHYLEKLCNDNIIIYRWLPHGSKKLEDLNRLRPLGSPVDSLVKVVVTIGMICHDQEPLDYYYYSESDIKNYLLGLNFFETTFDCSPLIDIVPRHLAAIVSPLSIHTNTLLCHSEKNSDQLKLYEQNNFIGVYYWSHALIARDWFRFAEYDLSLKIDYTNINYDFLIYNRAWSGTREYRLKFVELLINSQLHNSCNIKFNPMDNGVHYTEHVFKNKNFELLNKQIELSIKQNTSPSWASADYNQTDYNESGIEVILETIYDDQRNHLTEKTLRPIACGKPFILASGPQSLAYLRDYGFKTFDGLINESYDLISDPVIRLQAIIDEMRRISNLTRQEKIELWKQLYDIAEYNKRHFFSKEFHTVIVDEFVNNFRDAFAKCQKQKTRKWVDIFKTINELQDSTEFQRFVKIVETQLNQITFE